MNPTLSKTNNNIHLIEELPTPLSNRVVGDHTSDARREILFPPTCQHVNANPWAWKQHGQLLLYVPIERNEYEPGTQESQTRHRWINGARTRDPWKPKLSPDSHCEQASPASAYRISGHYLHRAGQSSSNCTPGKNLAEITESTVAKVKRLPGCHWCTDSVRRIGQSWESLGIGR